MSALIGRRPARRPCLRSGGRRADRCRCRRTGASSSIWPSRSAVRQSSSTTTASTSSRPARSTTSTPVRTTLEAYAELLARGGSWAPPEAVREAMAEWLFQAAMNGIDDAEAALDVRDDLSEELSHVDLAPTATIEDEYQAATDLEPVVATLTEQLAAARRIVAGRAALAEQLDRLGLDTPDLTQSEYEEAPLGWATDTEQLAERAEQLVDAETNLDNTLAAFELSVPDARARRVRRLTGGRGGDARRLPGRRRCRRRGPPGAPVSGIVPGTDRRVRQRRRRAPADRRRRARSRRHQRCDRRRPLGVGGDLRLGGTRPDPDHDRRLDRGRRPAARPVAAWSPGDAGIVRT